MLKIGSHVNVNSKEILLSSAIEALSYQANTFMIYTGAPQNTMRRSLSVEKIKEAHEFMKKNNLPLEDIVVHAPYIMNLANPDPDKFQFAVRFFTEEVNRTSVIGAKQIVLHPGAHVGTGEHEALKRIAKGIDEVLDNTKDKDVKIALETMAGKGSEVGKTFEELAEIIHSVTDNERLSVCFDTCHTHDYGYHVKEDFDSVINEFDKIIGISRISAFHINDSKNQKGARKDRHENIGFGHIGFDALNYIVHHKQFEAIPKILETPFIEVEEDQFLPPYLEEISNFRNSHFEKQGILAKL